MADWRLRRENLAEPFPYVYPRMPARFRWRRGAARILFLLEWGCVAVTALSGLALCGVFAARGGRLSGFRLHEGALSARLTAAFILSLLLRPVCRTLRRAPKFCWRCPRCGLPFPYYAPPFRGLDELREEDCLHAMRRLRIPYVKQRFCPLILPSECPECRAKFFELPEGFPGGER